MLTGSHLSFGFWISYMVTDFNSVLISSIDFNPMVLKTPLAQKNIIFTRYIPYIYMYIDININQNEHHKNNNHNPND